MGIEQGSEIERYIARRLGSDTYQNPQEAPADPSHLKSVEMSRLIAADILIVLTKYPNLTAKEIAEHLGFNIETDHVYEVGDLTGFWAVMGALEHMSRVRSRGQKHLLLQKSQDPESREIRYSII